MLSDEKKKPPEIAINNPGEISKLNGCIIENAHVGMKPQIGTPLIIFDVNHPALPNKVRVIVEPVAKVEFGKMIMNGAYPIVIKPIFQIGTQDVVEGRTEG